jgi:hypothetical protein
MMHGWADATSGRFFVVKATYLYAAGNGDRAIYFRGQIWIWQLETLSRVKLRFFARGVHGLQCLYGLQFARTAIPMRSPKRRRTVQAPGLYNELLRPPLPLLLFFLL